jgi:hypothetical protein
MIGTTDGYTVTATASDVGITVAPKAGQFSSDGSASIDVPITVARSVSQEYYLVNLTSTVGESARTSMILVVVQAENE